MFVALLAACGSSDSSSYDDDDESSSSYKTDEESVLGKCSAENNGMLAYDSNHVLGYSSNYYYYCDGSWEFWEAAPSEMIDTLGWGSAEDGTVYFVHDGSWRLATDMELCWMLAIAIPTRRLLLAEKPGG